MSHARSLLWAAFGVFERDWLIFRSYRMRVFTQTISLLFSLALFYYISRLVSPKTFGSPDDYFAFVVVGLLILRVLTSTLYTTPGSVQGELFAGTFERVLISPLGPVGGILAMVLFPFVESLVATFVGFTLCWLIFGLPVEWSTAALAVPILMLGTVAFACCGLIVTGALLVVKQAQAGTTWIVALISLISGLYFPVKLLPGWIEWAAEVQPFTPTVDLLRKALVDTPLTDSAWVELAKILGFAVVLAPVSLAVVAGTVRIGRRQGTILEY